MAYQRLLKDCPCYSDSEVYNVHGEKVVNCGACAYSKRWGEICRFYVLRAKPKRQGSSLGSLPKGVPVDQAGADGGMDYGEPKEPRRRRGRPRKVSSV